MAYDIADDRRRLRLAKALQSFGDRVQYSVFVVDASEVRLRRMRREVERIVRLDQDAVLICDVGPVSGVSESRFVSIGVGRSLTDGDSFII
ncbi:CRISPR-associated endonuclease Cas2 [Mobilicoccus caccae]|uniref:CRISPR-associated endonuclease Cas2 n=1 Tax=Mobilicoccus caccae TaxID=1859295 RepID=UPI0024E103BC|nr:CRISPR-associated endonuclease Cas2 [Mobilicoccus caccae]